MKRIIFSCLILIIILVGCSNNETNDNSSENEDERQDWPSAVTITAGPMGGPWYPAMVEWADLIMSEFKDVNVTVIEGSGYGNIRIVNKGEDAQIGMAHAPVFDQAVQGKLDEIEEEIDHVKAGNALMSSYITPVVPADNDEINYFGDIKDKRVLPGLAESGPNPLIKDALSIYDLDYEKIRDNGGSISYTNYAEMPGLLNDGHADVAILSGEAPHASGIEMEANKPIKILPIEDDKLEEIKNKFNYIDTEELPGGVYEGQQDPIDVFVLIGHVIYNDSLPDDFVYEITRVFLENQDELKESMEFLDQLNWDTAIPSGFEEEIMHPGAYQAIKEGK